MAVEIPTWIYKSEGDKQTASEMNQLAQAVIANATELSNAKDGVANVSNDVSFLENRLTTIEESVTNLADDDDLENTIINGAPVIREKTTKTYNPGNYSGMGRVILRKNMVNGVNVLTQEMINQANTIYEIRYDFDLNGAEITIPKGCTLKFFGGSFKNGILKGNNTKIINFNNTNIFSNVYFGSNDPTFRFIDIGKFIVNGIVEAKWFGIIPNISDNQQDKFEQLSSFICCTDNIHISFDKGIYKFGKQDSINQRLFENTPANLILFIGHALLRVTGNVINNVFIEGNGCVFEDIYNHKVPARQVIQETSVLHSGYIVFSCHAEDKYAPHKNQPHHLPP